MRPLQSIRQDTPTEADATRRTAVDPAALTVYVTADGQIARVDPGPEHWLGFARVQIVGMFLSELLHPDDVVELSLGPRGAPASRPVIEADVRIVAFDGTLVDGRATCLRHPESALTEVVFRAG